MSCRIALVDAKTTEAKTTRKTRLMKIRMIAVSGCRLLADVMGRGDRSIGLGG